MRAAEQDMILYHSTRKEYLDAIRAKGLRLDMAVTGMDERAVWLCTEERIGSFHHELGDRILLEVNGSGLRKEVLLAHFSAPAQLRRPGATPESYKYFGDIPPDLLRLRGDLDWGLSVRGGVVLQFIKALAGAPLAIVRSFLKKLSA